MEAEHKPTVHLFVLFFFFAPNCDFIDIFLSAAYRTLIQHILLFTHKRSDCIFRRWPVAYDVIIFNMTKKDEFVSVESHVSLSTWKEHIAFAYYLISPYTMGN